MNNKVALQLGWLALACAGAWAQGAPSVTAAAQKAIETNPEVAARFNALRAAIEEIDAAAAAYRPRVDLTADAGRTDDRITNRLPPEQRLYRRGAALNVTQLLWDGLATRTEVSRLSHARMARYFEFLDATEQTALEAGRAHHEVLRSRQLVTLAEENLAQHRLTSEQIDRRVRAGVARGVDLAQAGARLAQAESNLVAEKSALHDAIERYRRAVGTLPPAELLPGNPMAQPLPESEAAALTQAASHSPAIAAAVEGLQSARAQAEQRRASYQPRIEARLRAGTGHNLDGIEDQTRDVTGQIALTWNLFNGGADDARMRQQVHLLNQASDVRDKACRDVRQNAAIAYNDTRRLEEQIVLLQRNVDAIEKARDAYRQQYDIGQRSLLDLLNSESELYAARRSLAQARSDRDVAALRTHAAMGTLVAALGLTRPDAQSLASDAEGWTLGDDAAARCPGEFR